MESHLHPCHRQNCRWTCHHCGITLEPSQSCAVASHLGTPWLAPSGVLVPCAVNTPRVTASNRHRRMEATHPAKLAGQLLCAALSAIKLTGEGCAGSLSDGSSPLPHQIM